MCRTDIKLTDDSPLIEAASAEVAKLRELTFEIDEILYAEPAPGVYSVAKILVDVGDLRSQLASLAVLVE